MFDNNGMNNMVSSNINNQFFFIDDTYDKCPFAIGVKILSYKLVLLAK